MAGNLRLGNQTGLHYPPEYLTYSSERGHKDEWGTELHDARLCNLSYCSISRSDPNERPAWCGPWL